MRKKLFPKTQDLTLSLFKTIKEKVLINSVKSAPSKIITVVLLCGTCI